MFERSFYHGDQPVVRIFVAFIALQTDISHVVTSLIQVVLVQLKLAAVAKSRHGNLSH